MYFVNDKPFDDLLDAIQHCKARPSTILKNSNGDVLMMHLKVPQPLFRDIEFARMVLKEQLKKMRESN
jgi:hypothetical protein